MQPDPDLPAALNSHCPRCGTEFHCGVADPVSCACGTLTLDAGLSAALRQRFRGCLCLRCLQALVQQSGLPAGPPSSA